jgi:hypothetical protein
MISIRKQFGIVALLTLCNVFCQAEESPTEAFANGNEISDIAISPDGRYVARITGVGNHHVAALLDIGPGGRRSRRQKHESARPGFVQFGRSIPR